MRLNHKVLDHIDVVLCLVCFERLNRGIKVIGVLLDPVEIDPSLMQIGHDDDLLGELEVRVLGDEGEAVALRRVQGRVTPHLYVAAEIEDVRIKVKYIVLRERPRLGLVDQVVAYLVHIILVVNVTVDESVEATEQATNELRRGEFALVLDALLVNVEDLEQVVRLLVRGLALLQQHY